MGGRSGGGGGGSQPHPNLTLLLSSLLLDMGGLGEPLEVVGPSGAKMIQDMVLSFIVF